MAFNIIAKRSISDAQALPPATTGTAAVPRLHTVVGLNPIIALDASKGITMDANNRVSAWVDQSGNGNNASQIVGADQPTFGTDINGTPVLAMNPKFMTHGGIPKANTTTVCICSISLHDTWIYPQVLKSQGSAGHSISAALNNNNEVYIVQSSYTNPTSHFITPPIYAGTRSLVTYMDNYYTDTITPSILVGGVVLPIGTNLSAAGGIDTADSIGVLLGVPSTALSVYEYAIFPRVLSATELAKITDYITTNYI